MLPYMESIMAFLEMLARDRKNDYGNEVLSKAVGLVGDIASSLGGQIKGQIGKPFVMQLLKEGHETGDQTITETANWASSVVQHAMAC